MADKRVIVVFGATGAQGGGLVRAIQANPSLGFVARAVTRDVSSEKAKALAALGAELVQADVSDAASVEKACEGAYGAFCVTFFWNHFSVETEMQEAKNQADAARKAGVKHVIWSTLEDTRKWVPLDDDRMPTLHEHYKVPHFDSKGSSDKFFEDLPTTFLITSFYFDNFIHFGMGPRKGEDGKYALALPMGKGKLPAIAAEDIGRCALGIFNKGEPLIHKRVGIAGEHLSGEEFAAKMGSALGIPVSYASIPFEVYQKFPFPGAADIANMFQFSHDFEDDFRAARSIEFSSSVNPELQSFDAWLKENAKSIPL